MSKANPIQVIERPRRARADGTLPKMIQEFIGTHTDNDALSMALMTSPAGWSEPGQCPEFDEYTLVLHGALHVETRDDEYVVREGQALRCERGHWVRYSTPETGGAHYVSVCMPAFSVNRAQRDKAQRDED
jgi:quercetin dioxygenase-like cupin family protein